MAWSEFQRAQLADRLKDLWPSYTTAQIVATLNALGRFRPDEINHVLEGLFASQERPQRPTVREILDAMPQGTVKPRPQGPCGLCGGDEDWPIELRAARPDKLERLQIPQNMCASLVWISSRTDIPDRDRRRLLVVVDLQLWKALADVLEAVSLPFRCPRCAPAEWPKLYTTPSLLGILAGKWRIQLGYEHRLPTLEKVLQGIPLNQGPLLMAQEIAQDHDFWEARFDAAPTREQLDWLESCRHRLAAGGEILAGAEDTPEPTLPH